MPTTTKPGIQSRTLPCVAETARKAAIATRRANATADDCFQAMQRHHERGRQDTALRYGLFGAGNRTETTQYLLGGGGSSVGPAATDKPGDIIYGARAIARFIFDDDSNKSRRRVFNLWAHYHDREEQAGFLKLKGALCLSKSQWRAFHGLG